MQCKAIDDERLAFADKDKKEMLIDIDPLTAHIGMIHPRPRLVGEATRPHGDWSLCEKCNVEILSKQYRRVVQEREAVVFSMIAAWWSENCQMISAYGFQPGGT